MNNFVGIDLGASGTRVTSFGGLITHLPNNTVFVQNEKKVDIEPRVEEGNVEYNFIHALDATIFKIGGMKCEHFPMRAIVGDMAERYSATNVRPSVLKNKTAQRVNFSSAILAVAYEAYVRKLGSKLDLYIALPPMEVKSKKEEVEAMLKGKYTVEMNKMNKEVISFEIENVYCVEESFLALLYFFFGMDLKPTQNAVKYSKGNTLGLDIGASTTDLAVAKDLHYLEKSGQTFKTGGNVIQDYIGNEIRNKFGYDPTVEEKMEVVATGRLPMGNTYVDMSNELKEAKREFAASIVEQMQSYFRMVNIPLQSVRCIVVSGGGSLESYYMDENGEKVITCESVAKFITDEMNNVVDGIDVVEIPGNAREANIRGMFIRAMIDRIKAMKEEAKASGAEVGAVAGNGAVQNTEGNVQ